VEEEEEEEPKTPLQSTSEKGKNTKGNDDESYVPCNQLTIKSRNVRKGVHHHMFVTIGIDTNETYQLDNKYPIFCKNFNSMLIVKNGTEMEEMTLLRRSNYNQLKLSPNLFLFSGNNQQRSSGSIHLQRLVTRNIILLSKHQKQKMMLVWVLMM
jgi:hypothetical protein